MIVFVAGMPRSGSTFTFNIIRGLLERRGRLHQTPVESVLSALEGVGSAEHVIFKGHAADDITLKLVRLGAVKVVCSVRKPEDAIASWMDTFGFSIEESLAAMERWISTYREVKKHALVLQFDTIDKAPFRAAWAVTQHVCPDATLEEAEAVCSSFTKESVLRLSERIANREGAIEDIGFSYYDKSTFFHRRHVTSLEQRRADMRIGADELSVIRDRLSPYCDAEGNLR
jgi:hypothetical protein